MLAVASPADFIVQPLGIDAHQLLSGIARIQIGRNVLITILIFIIGPPVVAGTIIGLHAQAILSLGQVLQRLPDVEIAVPELQTLATCRLRTGIAFPRPARRLVTVEPRVVEQLVSQVDPGLAAGISPAGILQFEVVEHTVVVAVILRTLHADQHLAVGIELQLVPVEPLAEGIQRGLLPVGIVVLVVVGPAATAGIRAHRGRIEAREQLGCFACIETGRQVLRAVLMAGIGRRVVARAVEALHRQAVVALGQVQLLVEVEVTIIETDAVHSHRLRRGIALPCPALLTVVVEVRIGYKPLGHIGPVLCSRGC